MSDKELEKEVRSLQEAETTISEFIDYIANHYISKSLVREAIGDMEAQCNCEDDLSGYHGKWCDQNGLYDGRTRNQLRSELLTKLGLEANE